VFSADFLIEYATVQTFRNETDSEEGYSGHTLEPMSGDEGYYIEAMTALFGSAVEHNVCHVTFTLPPVPEEELGNSVGGRLVDAVVGGEFPLEICIGEIVDGEGVDFLFHDP
jgi:hypothetical protein